MKSTDLLHKNRFLFDEMKKLAIRQEKCVSQDQMAEFLNLSNRRESLRREISKNNDQYGPIVEKGSPRGEKSDDTLNREIRDVIQSIQEVDRRVEKFILERRNSLMHQARRLRRGKKAVKGYGKKGVKTSKFLNKKG